GKLEIKRIPGVPANTMRNLLRRTALDRVFDQLRGKQTMDVSGYAGALSGSASGNPEGVPSTFEETFRVRNHVFLGQFGGGPRMLQGRLSVDNMLPLIKDAARILDPTYE